MATATCFSLNELSRLFYCLELLGYPVIQRTHFEFQGPLPDIALLRKAFLLEAVRYPIFKSVIRESYSALSWKLCWEPLSDVDPAEVIREYDFSHAAPAQAEAGFRELQFQRFEGFDSRRNPPFFAALCGFPGGAFRMITFFHHAAADSGGCLLFLRDWFVRYNALAGRPQGVPVAEAPLMDTPLTSGTLSGYAGALAAVARQARSAPRGRQDKLLYGKARFDTGIDAVFRSYDPERMRRYLAAAKRRDTTFTSLFTAAQTLALDQWKKARGEPCDVVSIQIHKSLRAAGPELGEVQNRFAVFQVASAGSDRRDPAGLVRMLHDQSRRASETRFSETAIDALMPLRLWASRALLPVWATATFTYPSFGPSFQISNIGRIWAGPKGVPLVERLGEAEITGCYMPGHPMPGVGTFTSFCTYRDRLFLTFNYCTATLDRAGAEAFVGMIEKNLDELA